MRKSGSACLNTGDKPEDTGLQIQFSRKKTTPLPYSCPGQSARSGLRSVRKSRSTGTNFCPARQQVWPLVLQTSERGSIPLQGATTWECC